MKSRTFAVLSDKISPLRVNQFLGMPPELTNGEDKRQDRGIACFLVIEEKPEGFFLYRFNEDGNCVGDTWHANEEDAQEQADYEYGKGTKNWSSIPENVDDVVKFVLAHLAR